jgi:hypothetical protein
MFLSIAGCHDQSNRPTERGRHGTTARARTEAATGQRLTVLHEFKQLVDHGRAGNLCIGNRRQTTDERAERTTSPPAP